MYLVGVGAAITLTGACVGLLDLAARARARRAATAIVASVLVAGLASFAAVTRDITRDFEPFGPIVLSHDDLVRTGALCRPSCASTWRSSGSPGAARRVSPNPLDELSQVTFGVHEREKTPTGAGFMWMSGPRTEIHLVGSARSVTIPLRHQIESFRDPARAASRPTVGRPTTSRSAPPSGGCRRCPCDQPTCRGGAACTAFGSRSTTPGAPRK